MNRIAVFVEGGVVHNVVVENADKVEVAIIDYDTEGADEERLVRWNGEIAYGCKPDLEVDPETVSGVFQTIEKGPTPP